MLALLGAQACAAGRVSEPARATTAGSRAWGPVCLQARELQAAGEMVKIPRLGRPPERDVPLWSGTILRESFPTPDAFVRCRPCDCITDERSDGTIMPWGEWDEINRRAHARLRTASAPYPIAVIPGFHAGGPIVWYRLRAALDLLENGWVASLMVSGGHRRGGHNEARYMLQQAQRIADELGIEVRDRIFVEPCASTTLTNLRNSLRMMAHLGIDYGLLVTESKLSGQAMFFHRNLESTGLEQLGCSPGRVSHLYGDGPFPRFRSLGTGCQPNFTFRNNPVGFLLPSSRPSFFWISPHSQHEGQPTSAADCAGGSPALRAKEPDDQNPWTSECLPPLTDRPCKELSPMEIPDDY